MNNENGLTPSQLAERNAILVTEIEKCRELSGCPADVDLQDWVKMLVSELSVVEEIHNSAVFITDELYDASPKEVQGIIRSLACMKMPAYASLVAGIKADGVEMFVEKCREKSKQAISSDIRNNWWLAGEHADDFAKQLREGADK
ncbi:hypothetical protein EJ432_22975 [Klebsiella quasipneumoniae]|uniref:hypothetical protein n=1 Tax=Klebsiella quasipneumoniae TaxID=1463165 RepID=UPI0013627C37|nr:hypothetical protein [Klebsiella quasipneumoniae]NBI26664.1 hypothetical protein [Klebsiella quasipneumoniae]